MKVNEVDGTFSHISESNPLKGFVFLPSGLSKRNSKKRKGNSSNELFSFYLEEKETSAEKYLSRYIEVVFYKTRISNSSFEDWIQQAQSKELTLFNVTVESCIDDDSPESGSESDGDGEYLYHPYKIMVDKDSSVLVGDALLPLEAATDIVQNASKKVKKPYMYTKIADIKSEGTYNVYGVVYDYKNKRKLDSSLCSTTFRLIDETCTSPGNIDESLLVTINMPNEQSVINCHHAGQLVRCHRLNVKKERFGKQGNPGPGFDCILLNSTPKEEIPDDLLNRKTFTAEDFQRIEELRDFSQKFFSQSFDQVSGIRLVNFEQKYLKTIENIRETAATATTLFYADIICRVDEIILNDQSLVITVSDGTGVATVSIKVPEIIDYIAKEVKYMFTESDTYIKLRNVSCGPQKDWANPNIVSLRMFYGSVVLLPQNHFYVTRLKNSLPSISKQRNEPRQIPVGNGAEITPLPAQVVTKVDFSGAIISTVQEVASCNKVPFKYRTRAKVIDYFPKNIEEFCKAIPNSNSHQEYKYLFQIKLLDEATNTSLIVFVVDKDAEYFLQVPASNLVENTVSKQIIEKKIQKLLSPNSVADICLVAYHGKSSEVRFNLFGTTILDNE